MSHLALGLGGFHHESAWHWPGHGGSVEAVVDEPLGNILRGDAGGLLQLAQVHNELVGAGAIGPLEQHRVVWLQHLGHVVGVQDGQLGGLHRHIQDQ